MSEAAFRKLDMIVVRDRAGPTRLAISCHRTLLNTVPAAFQAAYTQYQRGIRSVDVKECASGMCTGLIRIACSLAQLSLEVCTIAICASIGSKLHEDFHQLTVRYSIYVRWRNVKRLDGRYVVQSRGAAVRKCQRRPHRASRSDLRRHGTSAAEGSCPRLIASSAAAPRSPAFVRGL